MFRWWPCFLFLLLTPLFSFYSSAHQFQRAKQGRFGDGKEGMIDKRLIWLAFLVTGRIWGRWFKEGKASACRQFLHQKLHRTAVGWMGQAQLPQSGLGQSGGSSGLLSGEKGSPPLVQHQEAPSSVNSEAVSSPITTLHCQCPNLGPSDVISAIVLYLSRCILALAQSFCILFKMCCW